MNTPVLTDVALRQILLVRAVEETQADRFSDQDQAAAGLAALSARNDAEVLSLRAAHLCRGLPRSLSAWLHTGGLPVGVMIGVFILSLVIGLGANYLGGTGQFHIVYNPVTVLLLWNLLAYVLLAWNAGRATTRGKWRSERKTPAVSDDVAKEVSAARAPWWLRRSLPGLWRRYLAMRHGVQQSQREWQRWQMLGERYLQHYLAAAGDLLSAQLRMALHVAALAMSIGAVAGLYFNGLFAEYHAVWRSTFIADPGTIQVFVNAMLGVASLLLEGQWIPLDEVQLLMSAAGAPASGWLHKLALMSVVVVLLPRLILVWRARRQVQLEAASLTLSMDETYYAQTLQRTQERHIRRIRDELAMEIREEIDHLAAALSQIVQKELFDARIQPRLLDFRKQGGRVDELEAGIRDDTANFEATLRDAIKTEQQVFAQKIQARLYAMLGRELALYPGHELHVTDTAAWNVGNDLGNAVAGDVSDAIGLVVATAVSAAVGSLSGGIGKGIGIAVISHLLGTSGPIGLLIGAGIGLAGGGAMYVMGKDKLKGKVKGWNIPAAMARMALRESKLEESRSAIAQAVQTQVRAELSPAVEGITNALLAQLPRNLGS